MNHLLRKFLTKDKPYDTRILIPWLEGNIQLIYIISKRMNTLDELKSYIRKCYEKYEEVTNLSEESKITKEFLEKISKTLEKYEDIQEIRHLLKEATILFAENRIKYHEILIQNPKVSLYELTQTLLTL